MSITVTEDQILRQLKQENEKPVTRADITNFLTESEADVLADCAGISGQALNSLVELKTLSKCYLRLGLSTFDLDKKYETRLARAEEEVKRQRLERNDPSGSQLDYMPEVVTRGEIPEGIFGNG